VPLYRSKLVPLEDLPRLLIAADVHLITLRDCLRRLCTPFENLCLHRIGQTNPVRGWRDIRCSFLATHGLAPDRYCRVDVGDVDRLVNELQATECAVVKKCESRGEPTGADLSGCKLAIQSEGNGHWAAGALTGA
jgi:hypothetical protein